MEHHHHHHHHYHVYDPAEPNIQRRQITGGSRFSIGNGVYSRASTVDAGNPSSSDSCDSQNQMRKLKTAPLVQAYASIKTLSLSHLTAKQHLLMALCRDVSLLPPITYTFSSLRKAWRILFQNNVKLLHEPQSLKDAMSFLLQNYAKHNATVSNNLQAGSNLESSNLLLNTLTTARASEYMLCSLWCIVSLYLTYSILDSLMVRWIVKYSTLAAILRMFSMSLIIITLELLLLSSLSPKGDYHLHTWILLSCLLTSAYIWQNYLTSNLNYVSPNDYEEDCIDCDDDDFNNRHKSSDSITSISLTGSHSLGSPPGSSCTTGARARKSRRRIRKSFQFTKKRTIDFYNITVFCVVPVGFASFITMIGLLRNLVIQRLDVEQLARMIQTTNYFQE